MPKLLSDRLSSFHHRNEGQWYTPHIPTGIEDFDKAFNGGLTPGLIILGALSSLGKTTLAMQIGSHISSIGKDCLIVSLEMTDLQLISKSISRQSFFLGGEQYGKSALDLRTEEIVNHMDQTEWKIIQSAIKKVEEESTHMYYIGKEDGVWTPHAIWDYIKKEWIEKGKPSPVVIIDYLQIIPSEDINITDSTLSISKNCKILQDMSKFLHMPVIVISSINRGSYYAPIDMSSFKGSGDIEYCADTLLGLQYQNLGGKGFNLNTARQAVPRKVELIIIKDRESETGRSIPLNYYSKFNYFENSSHNTIQQSAEQKHIVGPKKDTSPALFIVPDQHQNENSTPDHANSKSDAIKNKNTKKMKKQYEKEECMKQIEDIYKGQPQMANTLTNILYRENIPLSSVGGNSIEQK